MEMKMENDDCGNKSIILFHGIAPVYCFIISRYPRARARAWSRVMDLFLPRHGGAHILISATLSFWIIELETKFSQCLEMTQSRSFSWFNAPPIGLS